MCRSVLLILFFVAFFPIRPYPPEYSCITLVGSSRLKSLFLLISVVHLLTGSRRHRNRNSLFPNPI